MFILFRGIFLFIMYSFLYAWNVYGIYFYLYGLGWNKSNINYKLIFKFNRHYSKLDDILRRACILSFIFFLNLLIFTVLQNVLAKQKGIEYICMWLTAEKNCNNMI